MIVREHDRRLGAATSSSPAGSRTRGHPLACASAVASIEAFQEEGIVENSAAMGDVLRATSSRELAEKHPSIGEVRGLGCFWGLELVKNRETREPLVPFNARGRGGDAGGAAREGARSSAAST